MIGKILMAGDMDELQNLCMVRSAFFTSYITECKNRGVNFVPNKLKIVVINDTDSFGDDYIVGSILLPDSKAMFHLIEGDLLGFMDMYYNKLDNDRDVQEYLIVLIAGLVERGFDYVFYFDNNDYSIWSPIANALQGYLYNKFGLSCVYSNIITCQPQELLSHNVKSVVNLQNLIRQYKLSKNPEALFNQL